MSDNINQVPVVELQASQLELVVSEKTIGSLTTNAKQIRALVEKALPQYDISNYSADDVAKAKADKALLNKAAKTLNDKRVEFEREFMAPFGEFKEVVADTVKLIKDAVGKIDTVIKEDEDRSKREKREAVEKLAESVGVEEAGIRLDLIWNDKWLNKTTSMKSIETEIRARLETIAADLETLKTFAEDYDVLVVRYKENLNLQDTVRYANQLKEQREASKAKEVQEKEQTETKQAETPEQAQQPEKNGHGLDSAERDAADAFADVLGVSDEKPEEPKPAVIRRVYSVFGTEDQLQELETYLAMQGLEFDNKA